MSPVLNRSQVLARERAGKKRAGLAGIAGGILGVLGFVLLRAALSGSANFEGLEEAHQHSSTVWISGAVTLIGASLLAIPLLYLFRAAQARSSTMKGQLVGVVLLGPLLLGVSGILLAGGTQGAANNYREGKAKSTLSATELNHECKVAEEKAGDAKTFGEEFEPSGGESSFEACETKKTNEDTASHAITETKLVSIAQVAGLAGGLALVVGLLYTCLQAMRVGLLTRFWGSLGMAVGVAALIGFTPIMMLWFIYLGLLIGGWLPRSRPAAWDAGEAVPWATPGERAAKSLEGSEPAPDDYDQGPDPGEPIEAPEPPEASDLGNGDGGERRRKRKRRD